MSTQQRFTGGVFSSELPGGRCGADLSLTQHALVATTPDGQLFSVPFRGADVSIGGTSGKMWFCRSTDKNVTIFCEEKGFAAAFKEASKRELGDVLSALDAAQRSASRSGLLTVLGVLAALALVVLGLVFGLRHAGRLAVQALPTSVDTQLGKLASEHMSLGARSTDPVLNAAVQAALKRLAKSEKSPFKFDVRVVESPVVNAFALPGGPIVVFTGLLREAESAEQLAGVMAHEMAHVTRRHGMQRIAQSLGVVSAVQLLFGDVTGVLAVAVEVLREGAINSYSRDQEHEADMDGVDRMQHARLDANALADLFAVLKKQGPELPDALSWLGDHPQLDQRIRDVRARAQKQPAAALSPLAIDWAEVRRRAGKAEEAAHDEEESEAAAHDAGAAINPE